MSFLPDHPCGNPRDALILALVRLLESSADSLTVRVEANGKEMLLMHLPPRCPCHSPPELAVETLNDLERDILEAIDNETLIGEKIAELVCYPFDGRFRMTLAGLRRRGLLENMSPGYRRTKTGGLPPVPRGDT